MVGLVNELMHCTILEYRTSLSKAMQSNMQENRLICGTSDKQIDGWRQSKRSLNLISDKHDKVLLFFYFFIFFVLALIS